MLFALSLTVLVILVGIAIDGGFGLFQYRKAQNAADFAAVAAAQALQVNCNNTGSNMANGTQITNLIDDLVNANAPNATNSLGVEHWTGYYLNDTGQAMIPSVPVTSGGVAVVGACGVHIDVHPQWPPLIAQIIGVTHLQTAAGADAIIRSANGPGPLTSIVGLGENGAHTILEAGNGQFNVTGTIFNNANGWLNLSGAMWGQPDVIDGKQNGSMSVVGNIDTVANPPWDWCFGSSPPNSGTGPPTATWNSAHCSANNTTISYQQWFGKRVRINSDPVQTNNVPNPLLPTFGPYNDAACPGQPLQTFTRISPGGAGGVYLPGVYTYPVEITSSAVLDNCSQAAGNNITTNADPGMFIFEKGLAIRPGDGKTVTGNDVMLVTQRPANTIRVNGTAVQNAGDGEPVIGSILDNTNAVGWGSNPVASQGLNDSLEIGGSGTVNLTPPQTGSWTGFMTWQDPSIMANIGLDAYLSDTAKINISGIVYDNSDQKGQDLSHSTYWGNSSGIPYLPGGLLVAGFGIDSSTGQTCSDSSHCQVTINGVAIVDLFQTQGNTDLNITGSSYQIPGVQGSGAILTQ